MKGPLTLMKYENYDGNEYNTLKLVRFRLYFIKIAFCHPKLDPGLFQNAKMGWLTNEVVAISILFLTSLQK